MSKTNFTPGPWTMDSIDTPLQLAYGDVIGGDDSGNRDICANDGEILIAVLYGDGILPQTANAHLIAAAPEMYEAGEALHLAAWGLVKNILGEGPLIISDDDTSDWAKCARVFAAASCAWNRSADKARGGN